MNVDNIAAMTQIDFLCLYSSLKSTVLYRDGSKNKIRIEIQLKLKSSIRSTKMISAIFAIEIKMLSGLEGHLN